jgi:hypothetical protein
VTSFNAQNYFVSPTLMVTLKSSASFNNEKKFFERPEWNIENFFFLKES